MKRELKWLLMLTLALCLSACGDDDEGDAGTSVLNELVFHRENGEVIDFGPNAQTYVWCGSWGPDVPTPALRIIVYTTAPVTAGWDLKVVATDIDEGVPETFPNIFEWDQPQGVLLFIYDNPNELSTGQDGSSGSIEFNEMTCTPGGMIDFTIDATLESEFFGAPTIRVTGRFRGPIGEAPDVD